MRGKKTRFNFSKYYTFAKLTKMYKESRYIRWSLYTSGGSEYPSKIFYIIVLCHIACQNKINSSENDDFIFSVLKVDFIALFLSWSAL